MLHEVLGWLGGVGGSREAAKAQHRPVDVLAIAVGVVLAHAKSFKPIAPYGRSKRAWLRRVLERPNGIPSHATVHRVLTPIYPEAFEQGLLSRTRQAFARRREDDGAPPQIAVDGRRCGAGPRRAASWRRRPTCWLAWTSAGP